MKFINACLLTKLVLIFVMQFGCLSGGVMRSAQELEDTKDYSGAIEIYQSIVDSKPGTAKARKAQLAIGELYIEHMNEPDRGIKTYEAVIEAKPTSDEAAEAHYRIGMHAFRQKDHDTAQSHFDTIANKFHNLDLSHDALLMLAESYEEEYKFEQATVTLDEFLKRYPRSRRAAQVRTDKEQMRGNAFRYEAKRRAEELREKLLEIERARSEHGIDPNISPFGFGPYPEVPADYPYQERLWENATPEHELLVRVRVKLWKQGIQTLGAMYDNNNSLVYPTISGIIYVTWKVTGNPHPKFPGRRYAGGIRGHGETSEKWQSSCLIDDFYERTDITPDETKDASGTTVYVYPGGIKVYEYPDGGIDPYKFLGLSKDNKWLF